MGCDRALPLQLTWGEVGWGEVGWGGVGWGGVKTIDCDLHYLLAVCVPSYLLVYSHGLFYVAVTFIVCWLAGLCIYSLPYFLPYLLARSSPVSVAQDHPSLHALDRPRRGRPASDPSHPHYLGLQARTTTPVDFYVVSHVFRM